MHTALTLGAVLGLWAVSALLLRRVQQVQRWAQRRRLLLLVLALPLVGLEISIDGLHPLLKQVCPVIPSSSDARLDGLVPTLIMLCALGAGALGIIRGAGLLWLMARRQSRAEPALQAHANRLASRLDVKRVVVRCSSERRPLALTYGVWRPTVLLSTGLIAQLDQRELEAVLAHELSHIARRDYLVGWLATVLRDAFWYLPTSWIAYRQLLHDNELAADDLAITVTHRPLPLASALAKLWKIAATSGPAHFGGQLLLSAGDAIEWRIRRLLEPLSVPQSTRTRTIVWTAGATLLAGLLLIAFADLAVLRWEPLGCVPLLPSITTISR